MTKKILITGILGQDGATMAEYLLKNTDHQVFGMLRRTATPNYKNIELIDPSLRDGSRFELVAGDLSDEVSINNLVSTIQPHYLINFAANSFVGCSWEMPLQVADVNILGVVRCLEAIRKYNRFCRFYSAGSSEEFGDVVYSPQDINHPIRPRSPYGASKAAARHYVKVYRESYGLYAVHGILFNHEGIRRSEEFVTRKITKGVARIHKAIMTGGKVEPIELGNLDSRRDWSDAEDFVDGVWKMLNQDRHSRGGGILAPFQPEDAKEYVLASGESHTIREFVEKAFAVAGIGIQSCGKSLVLQMSPTSECYVLQNDPRTTVVKINPKFYRKAEVNELCGDASQARRELGWQPKVTFDQLVTKMVRQDMKLA